MAPSFDFAMSLFCAEDNESIIFDEVDNNNINGVGEVIDEFEICNWQQQHGNQQQNINHHQEQNFVGFSGILQSQECISSLFIKEKQHFPGFDYLKRLRSGDLDLSSRYEAIDWIQKVQSHYNFGPLCHYLSVNYLDRFLSTYELPKGRAWMMQLLAVACLSLAAKMDETDVPFALDLQVGESKFVFEAKTIQRMELLVLSTLNWRMQSVTPFSFIDYFLYELNGNQLPPTSLINQAIQLILSTIKGIDLLEFRASEIAAAVAISVSEETQTVEHPDSPFSFLNEQLEKERVKKCIEVMHDMIVNSRCHRASGLSSTSVPQSPIGVLDAACMSYKSDDTDASSTPSGSCANSAHNSPAPAPKRRRLDRTFHLEI